MTSQTRLNGKKSKSSISHQQKLRNWPLTMQDSYTETSFIILLYDRSSYQRYFTAYQDNIEVGPDNGYYIRICTEKTETEATLPISNEALELCGIPGSGRVFKGLTRAMTNQPLKQWISEAGIKKHITFHCFRHTFATLQIAAGTDIYTVSKMLTHRNVSTTQIYAELVSEKKRESANKISLK